MSATADNAHSGIEMGAVIAIAISWSLNKSIGWAILHGLCGWLYVIYYGVFLP